LIVLDASLVMEWLIGDQGLPTPGQLFDVLSDEKIIVPGHWPLEVANVIRMQMLRGKVTMAHLQGILDRLDVLDVTVDSPFPLDEIGPLANFSATHGLTSYDAAYVQLALQRQTILATLDRTMRTAAGNLNIAVLPA
jgi:predicted nucleic acid-binding protein